jgi:hypothetical protein
MSEIEIVWQDPPPKASTSVWAERLAPLRERPGEWARIREAQPAQISGLRQRLVRTAALKDVFEFRSHKVSDTQAELYARFTTPS